MGLAGKVILIVGELDDLAASIGLKLIQGGASLIFAGADPSRGHALMEQAEAVGGEVAFVSARPDSEVEAQTMIGDAIMTFGSIDGLVTLAGNNSLTEESEDAWEQLVDRNLRAAWLTTKFAMPFLRKSPHASVVLLLSQAPGVTRPGAALESIAQAGLHGLCRNLALEYGPSQIRVNGVVVGPLENKALSDQLSHEDDPQAAVAKLAKKIPLGRIGAAKDVAPAVDFLLSQQASWITGSLLHVDGGLGAASGRPTL